MQHSDVLAVSLLADKTFGKGFLPKSSITFYLQSTNYYIYCLKEENRLIGFVIWQVEKISEIKKLFHLEISFFSNYFKLNNTIGKLNQIAINECYRNSGFGNILFKESVKKLPTEVDFLTSTYWIKNEANAMRKLLVKNGFESIKIIPFYWYNDSIDKEYNCAICGSPPCKCSAEFFAIKKASKN